LDEARVTVRTRGIRDFPDLHGADVAILSGIFSTFDPIGEIRDLNDSALGDKGEQKTCLYVTECF
jgi:hypothetical protein